MKIYKILIVAALALVGYSAQAQNRTIKMQAGNKVFTASSSSASFIWFLNGTQQSETSNQYSGTWAQGTYWLTVAALDGSCIGDTFSLKLEVKNDVTQDSTQITFSNAGPFESCALSTMNPSGGSVSLPVTLSKYTLNGESFYVVYSIDGGLGQQTGALNNENTSFDVNTSALTSGSHVIRIERLIYGASSENVVDYSGAANAPKVTITVKGKPVINDIGF